MAVRKKKQEKESASDELRIVGVPKSISEKIKSIAYNVGVPLSSFMKPELRKIIDSYPVEYHTKRT